MGLDNPLHIAFLLVILLLVFGAKRLPEIGRSLGEGLRGFKSSIEGSAAPIGVTVVAAAQPVAAVAQPVATEPAEPPRAAAEPPRAAESARA
jgi:sec-independent protein translocase protein TatA